MNSKIFQQLKSPDWKEAPEFKIEGSSSDAQIQRFVELYSFGPKMIFIPLKKLIYILFSIYKEYHDKYGMPAAEYTSVDNLKKYDEAIQRMEIEGRIKNVKKISAARRNERREVKMAKQPKQKPKQKQKQPKQKQK